MSGRIESQLVMGLINLQTKIQKRINGALSVHGISASEYMVLLQLQLAPEHKLRRVDLAERVGLSASGVTRMLNPMQKIGLVKKEANARDARVSLVALTDAGQQIFKDAETSFYHASEALLTPLSGREKNQLADLLKTLL